MNPFLSTIIAIACAALVMVVSVCYGYKAGKHDAIEKMEEEYFNNLYNR